MHPFEDFRLNVARRHFFARVGLGLGQAALASLALGGDRERGLQPVPHHPPRATRAIYLCMSGGPSQIDLWDPKPGLEKWFDHDLPPSVRGNQRLTAVTADQSRLPVAPSCFRFEPRGKAGIPVSELLPWTGRVVDELCLVRSVHGEEINHDPALSLLFTGSPLPGRPSLGAWLSYGLGRVNDNLPAFVVLVSKPNGRIPGQAVPTRLWGAGDLPGEHQGVACRSQGAPVLFLDDPPGIDRIARRKMLDRLARLNEAAPAAGDHAEAGARMAQYELAFRMQTGVPELVDLSREPAAVREEYGPDADRPGSFAASCLLARRMVERGVRFVQVIHRDWDHHANVVRSLPLRSCEIDQPCYALLSDLKQRGLLDDTLVIWGGEFGRTVYCQGTLGRRIYGRDHHARCFSAWLAGAGVRGGYVHGETDEFSYNVVRDPVHVHDLNATILHALGLDAARLSVNRQGLEVRLTGPEPRAVEHRLFR